MNHFKISLLSENITVSVAVCVPSCHILRLPAGRICELLISPKSAKTVCQCPHQD